MPFFETEPLPIGASGEHVDGTIVKIMVSLRDKDLNIGIFVTVSIHTRTRELGSSHSRDRD